jgi:hypothetical protein
MLYEEIHHRFAATTARPADLDVNELDVVVPGQTNDELIVRIMDAADDNGPDGGGPGSSAS